MNLKQKLSKKLKKTGGFTLIEMLIVVAIIAILVMVSIPLVSNSLDKAKTATDDANLRAAKAAALAEYMLSEEDPGTTEGTGNNVTAIYFYNAATGAVESANTNITGYNQMKQGTYSAGAGCVQVRIKMKTGEVSTIWVAAGHADT